MVVLKVFIKLGWFIKAELKNYILGIFILLLVALIDLLPPQIIGRVIDGITLQTLTGKTLIIYLVILVVAAILHIFSGTIGNYDIWGEYEVGKY